MNTRIARILFAALALFAVAAFAEDKKPAAPKDPITDTQRLKFRESERTYLQLNLQLKELELKASEVKAQIASIRTDAVAAFTVMETGCKDDHDQAIDPDTLHCKAKPEPPKPEAAKK